jgi:hypothetical protein
VRCTCRGGNEGYPDRDAGDITFEVRARGEGALLSVRHVVPDRHDYEPFARAFRDDWPRALARLQQYLKSTPRVGARS